MSATVSLAPLYKFGGWVVNRIAVGLNGDTVRVHLVFTAYQGRCASCGTIYTFFNVSGLMRTHSHS